MGHWHTLFKYISKFSLDVFIPFFFVNLLFQKCRLIVAQMTSTRCEIFNWALIPLTVIVTLFTFPFSESSFIYGVLNQRMEVFMLYLMAIIVTLQHVHYGICMVSDD